MKPLRIALVAALTLGLLALWLRSVDLGAMGAALLGAHPGWIAVAAAFSVVHVGVRAWRWQLLLGPGGQGTARWSDLWRWLVMGYAISFIIPGRAGEIVRPALLWRRAGVPFGRALGSVVLERILDVACIGAFLGVFVIVEPDLSPSSLRGLALVLCAGSAGVLLVLTLLARRHRPLADRVITALARWLPRRFRDPIAGFAGSLLDGLEAAFRARGPLPILGATVLTWLPVCLTMLAGLRALDIDAPATSALALVPLTALGIAVPTPAGVGGFHAAMSWGLETMHGVPPEPAAAAAVVTHAASVLPIIALGLYASWKEGLSLMALRRDAESARPSPENASP